MCDLAQQIFYFLTVWPCTTDFFIFLFFDFATLNTCFLFFYFATLHTCFLFSQCATSHTCFFIFWLFDLAQQIFLTVQPCTPKNRKFGVQVAFHKYFEISSLNWSFIDGFKICYSWQFCLWAHSETLSMGTYFFWFS